MPHDVVPKTVIGERCVHYNKSNLIVCSSECLNSVQDPLERHEQLV